jgi:hypothetical protein
MSVLLLSSAIFLFSAPSQHRYASNNEINCITVHKLNEKSIKGTLLGTLPFDKSKENHFFFGFHTVRT